MPTLWLVRASGRTYSAITAVIIWKNFNKELKTQRSLCFCMQLGIKYTYVAYGLGGVYLRTYTILQNKVRLSYSRQRALLQAQGKASEF